MSSTATELQIAAQEAARVAWDLAMSSESSHPVVLDGVEFADARGAAEAAILAARPSVPNSRIAHHTAFVDALWDCHGARLAAPEAVSLPSDASLMVIVTIRTPYVSEHPHRRRGNAGHCQAEPAGEPGPRERHVRRLVLRRSCLLAVTEAGSR